MTALTEKHRPTRIRDFSGLARPKAIMGKLVASPYASAWLFSGDSGTGKTTLALAVGNELGAQIIHVPAAECSVDKVRWLRDVTAQTPMFGTWYLVLIDEADRMSPAAQVAFLSLLDATGFPDNTIFIFTRNDGVKLEDRFLSRVKELQFNGAIDAKEFGELLYTVWFDEAPVHATAPLMHKIIESSGFNVRKALNQVEMELLMVPSQRSAVAA